MFSFITRTGVNNSCPAFCMSRTKWPLLVPRKLHPKRASYHGCQVRESPKTFNWWSDSDSYMPYKTNILSSPNQYVASTGRPAMLQNLKFLSKRVALFSCFMDRRFLCYSEGSCFRSQHTSCVTIGRNYYAIYAVILTNWWPHIQTNQQGDAQSLASGGIENMAKKNV